MFMLTILFNFELGFIGGQHEDYNWRDSILDGRQQGQYLCDFYDMGRHAINPFFFFRIIMLVKRSSHHHELF